MKLLKTCIILGIIVSGCNKVVVKQQEEPEFVTGWKKLVMGNSNEWVKKGVSEYDKGNKSGAMEYYQMALNLWPKNPWANYEIGLAIMIDIVKNMFDDNRPCDEYFKKARMYDPFQEFAYQGKKELTESMGIIMKDIEPALKRMATEKITAKDMRIFADGCMTIGEYELAAYGYHFLLHLTINKENGFDTGVIDKFSDCIKKLGAIDAAKFIQEQFNEYNRIVKEQNIKKG